MLQVGQGRAGAKAGAEDEVGVEMAREVFLKSPIKLSVEGGTGPKSSREACLRRERAS